MAAYSWDYICRHEKKGEARRGEARRGEARRGEERKGKAEQTRPGLSRRTLIAAAAAAAAATATATSFILHLSPFIVAVLEVSAKLLSGGQLQRADKVRRSAGWGMMPAEKAANPPILYLL
jgi:hypothetical protein